jgi:hypothetical protein
MRRTPVISAHRHPKGRRTPERDASHAARELLA